jgi:hypothetical protein
MELFAGPIPRGHDKAELSIALALGRLVLGRWATQSESWLGYLWPHWEVLLDFPHSFDVNTRVLSLSCNRFKIISKFLPIHHSWSSSCLILRYITPLVAVGTLNGIRISSSVAKVIKRRLAVTFVLRSVSEDVLFGLVFLEVTARSWPSNFSFNLLFESIASVLSRTWPFRVLMG